VLIVILLLAAASAAAAPTGGDWHLTGLWYTFANADDVRALALDGDALWAASASGGVARWSADGASVRRYLAPQHGLPCNDVRAVIQWRGRWWFGTCAGLAMYNPARDRMEAVSAPLPGGSVTAMAVDDGDRLWVATEQWWDPELTLAGKAEPGGWSGGGVSFTADGTAWTTMGLSQGLPSVNVRDVLAWNGTVWLATEPYRRWRVPEDDPDGGKQQGSFESVGGGVAQRDGSAWRVHDSNANSRLSDNARVLAASRDALWVGTGGRGVSVFHGGVWSSLRDCGNANRCIQDDYVTALAVGGDGAVWVGTSRFNGRGTGLNILDHRGTPGDPDDDAWGVLRAIDGLPAELVHAILPVGADATVWLGVADLDPQGLMHGRGLMHLQNDRRTMAHRSSADAGTGAPAGNDITAVRRNPASGELWVGTAGSGVSVRGTDGAWRAYTRSGTGGGLASDDVADMAIEPGGVVWVATRQTTFDGVLGRWSDGGLSRYEDGRWTTLSGTESGLPSNHLSALALDGRGKLWVGTGATDRGPKEHAFRGWGLAVIDTAGVRWERTFTFPTLTSNNITALAVTDNLLWVGTSYFFYVDPRPGGAQVQTGGGVSVLNLDSGQWSKITADQGLTVALRGRGLGSSQKLVDVRSVYPHPGGALWVGGMAYPEGAFVPGIQPDGVVDVLTTDAVTSHRFAAAGAVRAVQGDRYGFVWVATAEGGVRVRAGNEWIARGRARGGLPSDHLNVLSFTGDETWLGTATSGLVRLVGTTHAGSGEPAEPGDPAAPTAEPQPPVQRLTERVYLPSARREVVRYHITPVGRDWLPVR